MTARIIPLPTLPATPTTEEQPGRAARELLAEVDDAIAEFEERVSQATRIRARLVKVIECADGREVAARRRAMHLVR